MVSNYKAIGSCRSVQLAALFALTMPAMLRGDGAERDLPPGYCPGVTLTVSISIGAPMISQSP